MIPVHQSPFVSGSAVLPDREGAEQLIVLLKATFDLLPSGQLDPAAEQDAIAPADELRGDPEASSIAREAELVPPKPLGTDVFLVGHAVAPKAGTKEMEVRYRVGPVEGHALVIGDRAWHDTVTGKGMTDPLPFERMPLIYERAFGGEDKSAAEPADWEGEPRNPVGRGFRARKSRAEWRQSLLPNIEDPSAPMRSLDDRPTPVGFGPIGRHWEPRIRYTGTYDERWLEDRMPLLPADFDDRFHHAAPPDRIIRGYVRGGEPVEVVGCTPRRPLQYELPTLRPRALVRMLLRDEELELRCDSVTIDTDRLKLLMLYRAVLPVGGDILDVQEISLELEEQA